MSESWTSRDARPREDSNPEKWNVQCNVPSEKPAFPVPRLSPSQNPIPPVDPSITSSMPELPQSGVPNLEPERIVDPALTAELENRLVLLANAFDEVLKVDSKREDEMVEQVIELGLTLAGELSAGALEVEPERIAILVREALVLMEEEAVVHVRLHPEIFNILDSGDLLGDLRADPRIQFRMDAAVGQSGCVVESPHKRVDTRVDARIKQIRHLLNQQSEEPI